jgi:hypothetical protein
MYEAKADLIKNRLYIKLSGFMEKEAISKAADAVIREAKKLKPNFNVINDISEFKPTTHEAANEIRRAQEYLKNHNVGRVIRVIARAAIVGAMQLERTGKEAGYDANTVASIAEAEKLLGD